MADDLSLDQALHGKIEERELEKEMRSSYLDYAMSVIVGRALPDVRDGLKPVHRRVLYAMHDLGLQPNRAYRKCAFIVGEVMGKYHPHGDSAIYETLVRMAQDFALRYPLVDGQGNFGSIDGDAPAAYRYTEARLTAVAAQLLDELSADTVDYRATYDGTGREPVVEVRLEFDRPLVDVVEHRDRDPCQPRLGIPVGGRRIAIDRAEVALAVDQRVAKGEFLDHPDQRVVDRRVAVRMVLA